MDYRGELRVGLAADRQIRWAAADLTGPVEEGRRRLDLSPLAAVALGRCASAAVLLLRLSSKRPLRLAVDVRGDGPLKRVFAEAEQGGGLRGLVGEPQLPSEGEGLQLGGSLGKGLLKVTREDDAARTYSSQVELVTGEIGADVAHYLRQSEQRRSAVLVGVLAKPEGIGAAGGLIVEAMPEAEGEVVAEVERRVVALGSFSRQLDQEGLVEIVAEVLGGLEPEVTEVRSISYRCRCSRDRLLGHLLCLTPDQVAELTSGGAALQAECAFCGAVYLYSPDELLASEQPS